MIPSLTRWTALGIVAAAFAVGASLGWGLHGLRGPAPAIPIMLIPAPAPVAAPAGPSAKSVPAPAPTPLAKPAVAPAPSRAAATLKAIEAPAPAAAAAPAGTPPAPAALPIVAGVPTAVPTPGHIYRVEAGDTLSEIAQKAYGTTKRLAQVLSANPGLDPTKMRRGILVYVPLEKGATAPVAASAAPPAPAGPLAEPAAEAAPGPLHPSLAK